MWRNVAKSSLWFGFGSMCFFSCSFSKEITFRHVEFDTLLTDILYVSSLQSCNELWVMICSPISALCHFGVMILGLAFFKDSVPQRYMIDQWFDFSLVHIDNWTESYISLQLGNRPQVERGRSFQLTEEDLLRASRAVLPIANSVISTAQVIFSGEPSMTLKVSFRFGSWPQVLQKTSFSMINLGLCLLEC